MSPSKSDEPKVRVRDRIFETACDLFYKHGIREVGVDAIAAEAGTNKMSFYRNFASKDHLVAEYLEQKGVEFWRWWDAVVAAHPDDPRRQIEALFTGYADGSYGGAQGCALANATVELGEPDHPGRMVALGQKQEMRRRFRALAVAAGAARADDLGDSLMLLMEGGSSTRRTFCDLSGPLVAAALTARVLVDAYTGGSRATA